ncbi:hypothetical protein G1C96_0250 [Bifidobacterium sp. DSM 109958]|uniref:DUF1819 family protein n=1 Tax=Bifidobacterium moraviense TaxID=2675323 RepID=A0A7Y0F0B5_9BIFI|nr:DUF1819 family protein [Bifidobacterium sp. DSM 109958]NMM99672.1 hypothetical protein [Bifidobacterium sp. DSM 109958]
MTNTSYGTEPRGNERYRLSFTVGGLLASQGHLVAGLFMADGECADAAPDDELGDRIAQVRRRAVDENVLAVRTQAANVRMVREAIKRLSALTMRELRHLADADTPPRDCQALMWVAMCRYYALVGEFANEVLRDRYLLGMSTVDHGDYDRFILAKAMWHTELEDVSRTTALKLRSNVFRAMAEGELVDGVDNTLLPSLLGRTVTGILEHRPESFLFFPMNEH